MEEKYIFNEFRVGNIDRDFIFKSVKFKMLGNPKEELDAPVLFIVDAFRYVLIDSKDFINNEEFCFKVATYLYHHKTTDSQGKKYTYFLGDINRCKEIGSEFSNQICKYVSYEMINEWYPKTLNEINDYVVNYFLSIQRYFGEEFYLENYDLNYLFFISKKLKEEEFKNSLFFIKEQLRESGYLFFSEHGKSRVIVEKKGIEKYQKSQDKENSKLAFIAIRFSDNEQRIQAIQNAIVECGFEPRIMNEYETNQWIMPEIFHQIQISKFIVVDLSIRCDGAYYEAGYAHALGKEVIHIYDEREENNNPLHFDVAQKSTVIYKDFDDLKKKLVNRIKATIY